MATRLYLRETTNNTTGFTTAKLSTALPVGTENDSGTAGSRLRDLSTTKGAAQTSRNTVSNADQTDGDLYYGKWVSPALQVSSISANTWTLGLAASETNAAANAFHCGSIYVLQSDGSTVRGYIYDSHTSLGVELTTSEDGQVITVSGNAVSSVSAGSDKLAFEWWIHTLPTMSVAYTATVFYDGTTDVTDSTTTDAASYIETPQDSLFTAAAPLILEYGFVNFNDPGVL